MKSYLFFFISLFFVVSCNKSENDNVKLIPVATDEKVFYINNKGDIIINPQFDKADIFHENLALYGISKNSDKYGYIDEKGKVIINPEYIEATSFSEGIAWVVKENSAPVAINKKGKTIFTLTNANYVSNFSEGLAAYSITTEKGNLFGFVDKKGKTVINPQFLSVSKFSDGFCLVMNKEGKLGYIDKNGNLMINYQFEGAGDFINGKAIVLLDNKSGTINKKGKYIINPQFSSMKHDGNNFLIQLDGKYGWCDSDGKILINPQFDEAHQFFNNEIAPVKSGKSWGYIDEKGKFEINPQFDYAIPFNNNIALIVINEKIGFIDKEGKYVINPQYKAAPGYIEYVTKRSFENSHAKSDYFNVDAILNYIKSEITDHTVSGLSFNSPINSIYQKFKFEKNNSNIYEGIKVIDNKNISNDAFLDLTINNDSNTNLINGFTYKIKLINNGSGKSKSLMEKLEQVFSGYQKISNDIPLFENKNQSIFLQENKNNDLITITVSPFYEREAEIEIEEAMPELD